jgi:hypothetical protein
MGAIGVGLGKEYIHEVINAYTRTLRIMTHKPSLIHDAIGSGRGVGTRQRAWQMLRLEKHGGRVLRNLDFVRHGFNLAVPIAFLFGHRLALGPVNNINGLTLEPVNLGPGFAGYG